MRVTFIFPATAASRRLEAELPQAPILGDRVEFEDADPLDRSIVFQVARVTWRMRREGPDHVRAYIAELAVVDRPSAKVIPLRATPSVESEF